MNDYDPLTEAAIFGRQVHQFLQTDVGAYLRVRCEEQVKNAIQKLKEVDPMIPAEVMKAQNEVRVAESLLGFLADAIISGETAMEALKTDE